MRTVIEELAHERRAGRRVGTPGGVAAARWLVDHLTQLDATTGLDEFLLTGAVREVHATPELRWSDGDTTSPLNFRQEFCEHPASADRQVVQSGPIATTDGQLAQAWVVDSGFSADRVTAWSKAGALGRLRS